MEDPTPRWKNFWESGFTWSTSVFNGEAAHCPYILKRKELGQTTSPKSRPAIRGTLVHDFFEVLVKRMATEAIDLGDNQVISSILIEVADKKEVSNDIFEEAKEIIRKSLENDIFGDLNFQDALGIETGIALVVDESREFKVVPWDEGWEYDAPKELREKAAEKPFFRGKIDRFALRKEEGGGLVANILDYKSTLAMESEEDFQRLPNGFIYCWLLDKFLRQTKNIYVDKFIYRHAYLRYYNAKRGITVYPEMFEKIEDRIIEFIEDKINRNCTIRARGPFCKYCIEQEDCPSGREELATPMDHKSLKEQATYWFDKKTYYHLGELQADKELKKIATAAGGYIETDDLIIETSVTVEREYDFTRVATFNELGKEIAAKGDARGKPVTENDVFQIKHSSCNLKNMPDMLNAVSTEVLYKRATKTAKKGDKKTKRSLKAAKNKEFLST